MTHKRHYFWLAATIGLLASAYLNAQGEDSSPLENTSWQLVEIKSSSGAVQRRNPKTICCAFA